MSSLREQAMMGAAAGADVPYNQNLNMTLMCTECKEIPPNLYEETSSGDMVCDSCGLVLGDRIIDTRSEWRTFSNDDQGTDDPSRVGDGPNELLNGSQLSTTIAFGDGNPRSRDLLRAQGKLSQDKANKGLLQAYKEIGAHCDAIHLPKNVTDYAKHVFKIVDDSKAFKNKSQDAIIASCILIACRRCKIPRTFREIFSLTKVSKKEIGRTFKAIENFFEQSIKITGDDTESGVGSQQPYQKTTAAKARDVCIRFCSYLGLTGQQVVKVSQGLADVVADIEENAGRSPNSNAAACVYMAAHLTGKPKTFKEVGAVAGVTESTIRNSYKYLYMYREKVIDPTWIADGKGNMNWLPAA